MSRTPTLPHDSTPPVPIATELKPSAVTRARHIHSTFIDTLRHEINNRSALGESYIQPFFILAISHPGFYAICPRTLIRSAVTPMAVTSPPAPAPWTIRGLLPYLSV